MKFTMVRYRVKPDRVAENERLVRDVYDELASEQPDGFRYATFKLDDGVSFLHVAALADGVADPLSPLGSFASFQQGIAERCIEQPVVTPLSSVGSFPRLDETRA